MSFSAASLSSLQDGRVAVSYALYFTQNNFLTPGPYKQLLLDAFVRGELTMDQLLVHLEAQEYEQERRPAPSIA
ncbi:MAG TPA: hypothetical protein VK364_05135 [Hymenobacter sp.]|nr:hypothetical protein [Hymenobacter sp.]